MEEVRDALHEMYSAEVRRSRKGRIVRVCYHSSIAGATRALRRLNAALGASAVKPAVDDSDMNPNQPTLRLLVLAASLLLRNRTSLDMLTNS